MGFARAQSILPRCAPAVLAARIVRLYFSARSPGQQKGVVGMLFGPWWPFLLVALVLLALCFLAYRDPAWREDRWKSIEVASTLVMAAAAVSIPLVLDRNARDTRTLEALNEAGHKIAQVATKKKELDKQNGKVEPEKFSYSYVSSNLDVEAAVFSILNEYDYVCLGGNQQLFSNAIIKRLRWDALDQTWRDYRDYMTEYRKGGESKKDAWKQCDVWLKENPRVPSPLASE